MGVDQPQLKMKAFLCVTFLAACASAQIYRAGPAYGAGQTSHQSVTKADGEVRSVQVSKAFGAGHAAVHQVDNSKGLAEIASAHGAVINNGAHPVAHAVAHHAPAVVAHAPLVHHAPIVHHAPALVAHAPVVHHAPAVVAHAPAPYAVKDEVPEPYSYEY